MGLPDLSRTATLTMTRLVVVLNVAGAEASCANASGSSTAARAHAEARTSLESEAQNTLNGPHGRSRQGQTVVRSIHYGADTGDIDMIQNVVGLDARFEAPAGIAELEGAAEGGIPVPLREAGNGVAARVAERSGRGQREREQVEEARAIR